MPEDTPLIEQIDSRDVATLRALLRRLKRLPIAHTIAVGALLIYAAGLLITNSYLFGLGGASTELLRLQHLAAGTVFFVFLLLLWVFVVQDSFIFIASLKPLGDTDVWPRAWRAILLFGTLTLRLIAFSIIAAALGAGLVLWFPLSIVAMVPVAKWCESIMVSPKEVRLMAFARWVAMLYAIVGGLYFMDGTLAARFFGAGFILVFAMAALQLELRAGVTRRARNAAVALLFVLLISLPGFGVAIYPNIIRWIGGGQPVPVELILTDSCPTELRALLNGDGERTVTIKLVAETSSEVIVLIEPETTGRALSINRDYVASIARVGMRHLPLFNERVKTADSKAKREQDRPIPPTAEQPK